MIDKNYLRIFEYIINPVTITVPIITPINHSWENKSKFVIITIPIKFAIIIINAIIIKFLVHYYSILSFFFM